MSGFHKLKAYFGMVPAEYADDPGAYEDERGRYQADYRSEYGAEAEEYDPYPERGGRRRVFSGTRSEYRSELDESDDFEPEARSRTTRRSWNTDAPVHGALAVEPVREPISRPRPAAEQTGHPLGRITTLNPRSYNEARTIGERFRDGMLRANTLVAGPDPDLAGQVRAAQAIAMLSDPVVLFADAPAGELRAAVLDGVDRLFVTAKPEVKARRGRPTVMSPETIEAAQRLYDAGHTPADIAAALGVSRATIYRHLPGAEY